MPAIPQQQTIVQYTTNSAQLIYTFAFYAPLSTDIVVYYQASNVAPITSYDVLLLNTDYSVTFNADPTTGGYITLLFTPTTGYYLTINRQVAVSLTTNFANAQNFNGANLDAALDRLLLLIQQNFNYIQSRNLSYIINTYLPMAQPFTQLPPLALNQVWIGSGSGVTAALIASNPSASVLQSMLAAEGVGVDGARLVGYYDAVSSTGMTVQAFLANLIPFVQAQIAAQLFQPGDMKIYGGGVVQSGWLLCDGSAISRATYAALFAAVGTTWGIGNGSTTFNVPDFRRKVPVGSGGSGTGTLGNAVGNTGGVESVTLVANQLPVSAYGLKKNIPSVNVGGATPIEIADPAGSVDTTVITNPGGGQPTSIIQPSNVVTMIIKY